jgi:hypothetical protein
MFIRFRTQGTLDFNNLRYVVAFNTNGNGQYPLATSISSFLNWSFQLVFGGSTGGSTYALTQIYQSAGSYNAIGIAIPFQLVTNFNPNSTGTGNEFTFTFNRLMLNPLVTPAPGTTSPPGAPPTISPGVSTVWNMNFFTTDPAGNPLDSIGFNGATDTTPTCCQVNTVQAFDQVVNKPIPPPVQAPSQQAQIISIEVISEP